MKILQLKLVLLNFIYKIMTLIYIFLFIVAFVLFSFLWDYNSDHSDLKGITLVDKFGFIQSKLNEMLMANNGVINVVSNREFNLVLTRPFVKLGLESIQINFFYGAGMLTLTFYESTNEYVIYKFEKTYKSVRVISLKEQEEIFMDFITAFFNDHKLKKSY